MMNKSQPEAEKVIGEKRVITITTDYGDGRVVTRGAGEYILEKFLSQYISEELDDYIVDREEFPRLRESEEEKYYDTKKMIINQIEKLTDDEVDYFLK